MLGEREVPIREGATIYIPRNTRVALRNTGPGPLAIVFFFSRPGFEAYLRETSAMEGEPLVPLSDEDLARIRSRYSSHFVPEQR